MVKITTTIYNNFDNKEIESKEKLIELLKEGIVNISIFIDVYVEKESIFISKRLEFQIEYFIYNFDKVKKEVELLIEYLEKRLDFDIEYEKKKEEEYLRNTVKNLYDCINKLNKK